ncbi:MAG TPA: DedA family protein, partial [Acidobacteriota bacterium]|nr:DedA family protein [Acidobacteriota bacterium]
MSVIGPKQTTRTYKITSFENLITCATMLSQLIATYGYWAIGGIVAFEGVGLPVPGETVLVAAAVYAGTTHDLEILLVIVAAAVGSILGSIAGFWIGWEGGYRLLLRYGHYIRLTESKIKLGQYLFLRHGGKIVFFARFVAVLRVFAAVLAGANRMSWSRFLLFNAAGGIIWATLYGAGAYYLGERALLLTKH